jgi:phosphatidylglycerophosphate synthase
MEQVRATYKQRDAWWTVLLVDPLASRLLRVVGRAAWITPTRLTATAFLLGLAAAAALLRATPGWLVIGALLYHVSFVVDCMDGKIARLRGTGSIVGSWLDFALDRVRVFLATLALFGGQFLRTDDEIYLFAAVGVTFLALFGYLNGAETHKAKERMAALATGPDQAGPPTGPDHPGRSAGHQPALPPAVRRVRGFLHRHRIRMNLVSGIEFEMAMFVVAPLVAAAWAPTAILWVTAVAAGLLVGFELALIGRFWLTARSFDLRTAAPGPRLAAPPVAGLARVEPAGVGEHAHHAA